MSKIFFSSDHHYGHQNIIRYSNRPFKSIWHMDKTLTDNWNNVVSKEDTVYYLGDFAFKSKNIVANIRAQLNGKIILIRGNHDKSIQTMLEAGFDEVYNYLSIKLNGYDLYLSHIPIGPNLQPSKTYKPEYLNPPPKHDYFLCGHVHNAWTTKDKFINVGVDVSNYTPATLDQLIKI